MLRFLQMGGYARYVWPSYALTALIVGLNVRWALASVRAAQSEARRRLASLKAAS